MAVLRALIMIVAVMFIMTFPAFAATDTPPAASDSSVWAVHDEGNDTPIDHSSFDLFLMKYVVIAPGDTDQNFVDYGGVIADDKQVLDTYIRALEATSISTYRKMEQLAYWINLYNAVVLRTVIDHYPTSSIRDIDLDPRFLRKATWSKASVTVEGQSLTLDAIKHDILLTVWDDARVLYVLHDAAWGSPDILPRALTAATLDYELNFAAYGFVNHPRGFGVADDTIYLSRLYQDHASHFDDVKTHLKKFADISLHNQLESLDWNPTYHYDWRLNDSASVVKKQKTE